MQKYFIFGLMAILAACSSDKGSGLNDGWMNYRNTGVPTSNNGITSMIQNENLNLADAKFTLSNDDAGLGENMTFAVSGKGIITGIKFVDSDAKPAVRNGNTGFFRWNAGKGTPDISMGGSSEDGLQYSDFGKMLFSGDSRKYATYTGGYESNKVETITPNMSFKGHATGYVHGRDEKVLPVYGDATLNVTDDGAASLKANFKDWYTVSISGGTMNFEGYETDKKYGENYMFTNKSVNIDSDKTYFKPTYYGPDENTPSEVVGSFGHTEAGSGDNDAGVRLDAAFGGKKQ